MTQALTLANKKKVPVVILTSNKIIGTEHQALVHDLFALVSVKISDVVYAGYNLGKHVPSKMEYILDAFFLMNSRK